jgi:hypothetical protein
VVVSAFDGTKAVFSEGELDRALGAADALIALRQDGADLPAGRGRFRLVVGSDRGRARSISALAAIEVRDLDDEPRG